MGAEAPASPPAPAPTQGSFAGGRYELREMLGEGARKRVHLAWDTRLEREVALSLIKTEGLDEAGQLRARREAQAMARLGDHPNIGTVHDIGEEDGQLYIVSEYMPGGDLEQLLREAGEERRLACDEAVRIATQLCCALEHAHGRGVIHRDVKPGNVWLGGDGTAKLGDFGLAVSTDRSRITHEGMMVGTAAYMAPEQALGRAPDARSDLYALGATLYEMLTGRPPFLGDDAVAIISQHLHTPPVAPTWHNREIPQRLEKLVLELLEKDPDRRPANAAAVGERLAGATAPSAERVQPSEPPSANPLDRLASGVFVGREAELEALRAGLDGALSGRGQVLLLVGEPGIGKTRTSEELATYARLRGAQVLWGRCYEGEGAPAYWPWMQIIRAYVHEHDPQALLSEMGTGAADIAEVVSEVRQRLPGLPTPPKLDPDQARFRLFDSISSFLRNASQQGPLVLVLDDLHWADKPSLLFLQFLARELEGARLLLLATYRDVEVGRQHPLEQTLAELARAERADRVLLRGLSEDDVARFLELSSGRTPVAPLVEAVYRETEGNPFFVHEVVRLLQSDGRLEHPEQVASWSVEIPQGVRQVVGRRLDGLGDACNRVLTVASVMGREFELRVLARAAELPEDETIELLEEAEAARIVAPVEGAPGSFRFSHALVRETLYDEVRTTRRVRLHRRIAEVLEERHAGRLEPHLAELAYHYCEAASGGDVEKAVAYAQRAARRAIDALAFEEAADHFDRALLAMEAADAPDETLRCELLLSKGDALFRAGAGEVSSQTFRDAYGLARAIGSPMHVALALIGSHRGLIIPASTTNYAYVKELDEAIEWLGEERPVLRGQLLVRRAGQLSWTDAEEARSSTRHAMELIEPSGPLEALSEASWVSSAVSLRWEDTEQDLARWQSLVERAIAEGNRSVEFSARGTCAELAVMLGDVETADRHLERMAELADELREPQVRSIVAQQRAQRALREGRLAEAREQAWEGRLQLLRLGWPEATQQTFQAQLFGQRRLQGRMDETLETLRAGVAAFPGAPIWRGLLACACAESGDAEEARLIFDGTWRDDFAVIRRNPLDNPPTYGLVSEACLAAEHVEGARALYERLLPFRGQHLQLGILLPFGAAGRCLGNLALVLGRLDQAERHFEEAIALDRRMRARGWLPRTQCDYARMLLVRSGPGDRDRALALLDEAMATAQELGLKAWLDRCIETKLAAQGVDSGSTSPTESIDVLVASLGQRKPDLAPHGAPDGTVSLLFSDMQGFTEMTERLGDLRAHEVIRDHNRIVREQVAAHGGHEVEMQGDAFLLAFAEPGAALRCAVDIQRAFAAYSRDHPEPIRVRIGLHVGKALRDQERFFGRTVNLAARIAARAEGEEILASVALAEQLKDPGDARFGSARSVRLKGIAEPQEVHRVDWRQG
jgi:class 3 adenylate cyclase